MKAVEFIETAAKLVGGDRNRQHGSIEGVHQKIADLWGAYLGVEVSAQDVAAMMVLLKIGRTRNGKANPDDWVDAAGYAGIGGQLADEKAKKNTASKCRGQSIEAGPLPSTSEAVKENIQKVA